MNSVSVIAYYFQITSLSSIMALSRKEIIAILLLITTLLNVLNATYFANIVHLHSSYEQVAHQVVCVGTAYICVIYALSTWLYHSNYHRSRQEMRFVREDGIQRAVRVH
ncbi:uncharacterized protein [Drosophila kikkawai]|uniref:Uncharacterized protein isoform X2 n=1 Tax=Drosophila kikkawai TaxID=30033 RepID=A0A6P4IBI3_DROKI|nr:uncharacterized protein LOC108073183 isoform X3 [Drosophila kikkawai]